MITIGEECLKSNECEGGSIEHFNWSSETFIYYLIRNYTDRANVAIFENNKKIAELYVDIKVVYTA